MVKSRYVSMLLLILSVIRTDCQEFKLFDEGEMGEDNRYYNYSMTLNEYVQISSQGMAKEVCGRSVEHNSHTYDTLEVKYILNSKLLRIADIAYDSLEIELQILPKRDTIVQIEIDGNITSTVEERIDFDWQTNKKSCKNFRKSKNWKWEKTLSKKDTVEITTHSYSFEKLIHLEASNKRLQIFIPKKVIIDYDQTQKFYETIYIYKINSKAKKQFSVNYGAPYNTVTKQELLKRGGSYILQETVSNTELKNKLSSIKNKLKELGYFNGKMNNKLNLELMKSLVAYQRDNALSIGQFDIDTLTKLLK